jgi:hypothetical protein
MGRSGAPSRLEGHHGGIIPGNPIPPIPFPQASEERGPASQPREEDREHHLIVGTAISRLQSSYMYLWRLSERETL